MYQFLLNMWIMRKIDEQKLRTYVTKGYLTSEEADLIIATVQL